jgi:Nif-specific regulatory protein
LTGEQLSIGRDASNSLRIRDRSVSRLHCVLDSEGGQHKIRDLDSRNGVFVNDIPVHEKTLDDGDQIKIGTALFLFLLHEAESAGEATLVQFEDACVGTEPTMQLRYEESLYLRPDTLLASLPIAGQMARDLHALLKISTAINSMHGTEEIKEKLLELIFEIVPAERGAILLTSPTSEEFTSVSGRVRDSGPGQPVRVSRTIVQLVLRDGVSLLSNGVLDSEEFRRSDSLAESGIQSVLCVPLLLYGKALGVIYLDTSLEEARFAEDQLQLVTAIAGIAAVALENSRHVEWLESENRRLKAEMKIEHNMVGESARMREVYQFIAKVAPTESTVLICGESGTGKELAARAIHENSERGDQPFVAINCAALTESLLESELFGHEKGAFTGAVAQKKGKLEMADGGTLFLDEVGELAPALQAKLLRVLQEREFERVGGLRPIKVDIRLIGATNCDLEELVKNGAFRRDLYYRLNVVSLAMPSLRSRKEDIPLLANYFIARHSEKCRRRLTGMSHEARECLLHYDWPGNVREFENAIERAVVLGSGELVLPEDLPEAVIEASSSPVALTAKYHEAVTNLKKQLIVHAVEQAEGNYTEAAKILGVHANYLHRLIRNMGLKPALKK